MNFQETKEIDLLYSFVIKFLKDNNLINIYKKEYYAVQGNLTNIEKDLKNACKTYIESTFGSPLSKVNKGFTWDSSLKGRKFWEEMHYNFKKKYEIQFRKFI